MIPPTLRRAALCLALGVAALHADTRPVTTKEDLARLPAATAALYRDVVLFPQPTRYRDIPWLLDLEEGIKQAKAEKRPLLIWASGDDPLERC